MTASPYVCLAASSGIATAKGESVFENVNVLPDSWTSTGMGNTLPGFSTFIDDQFTVSTAGNGIGVTGNADSGEFVCTTLYLDGSITAHIASLDGAAAQAGVMFREAYTVGSRNVYMGVSNTEAGYTFQFRNVTNGITYPLRNTTSITPSWVRLTRVGNVVTGYYSMNGVSWFTVGSSTVTLGVGTTQACLATSSNNAVAKSTAVYQSVSVLPDPWLDVGVGYPLPGRADFVDGQFTVTASGYGQQGTIDSAQLICQSFPGDGSISARVVSINRDAFSIAVAGVTVRETGRDNVANVMFALINNSTAVMQHRAASGQATVVDSTMNSVDAPEWVRIVRSRDTYDTYYSEHGVTWTFLNTVTVPMNTIPLACLVSASSSAVTKTRTIFDSVSVLPAPWTACDLGDATTGFSSFDGNHFILNSGGPNIAGTSDSGHFMCQTLTGDGSFTARVVFIESVGGGTHRAGVMFRNTLTAASVYSYMYMASSGPGYNYYRTTDGGTPATALASNNVAPRWVRIVRSGDQFKSYVSSDGISWAAISTHTIVMNPTAYVCLAASSGVAGVKARSVFESVSVLPDPWANSIVGTTQPGYTTYLTYQFALATYGTGITDKSDSGQFVCRTFNGASSISARVIYTGCGSTNSTAGVMYREAYTRGSRFAFMALSGLSDSALQYRNVTNGNLIELPGPSVSVPQWVRVLRLDDTYFAYLSPDGISWDLLASATVTLGTTPFVCMASSSYDSSFQSTSVFESVTLLPYPWFNYAVNVIRADYAEYDDFKFKGLFTVTSSGSGIGGATDSADFVCHSLAGDGSITARVTSFANQGPLGSSGVMLRQEFTFDSPNAYMAVSFLGARFQSRTEESVSYVSEDIPNEATPYYVRVTRRGDLFSGYISLNSTDWQLVHSSVIQMYSPIQACLASSSGLGDEMSITQYESVSVLPAPWLDSDIAASLPGFSAYLDGRFTLTSGGFTIAGASDSGHFVCQRLTGDGSISARVISIEAVGGTHKAGVMFRDSLTADSVYSYMYMASSGPGYNYYRTATGGTPGVTIASNNVAPRWVRVTRLGTQFISAVSSNGISWDTIASPEIVNMTASPYVCLAASSGIATAKGKSMFENVNVLPDPWTSTGMGNTLPGFSTFIDDQFTVSTAGNGIGVTVNADSGEFVCRPLFYDGSITAKIESVSSPATQAGVMVRDTFTTSSRNVYLSVSNDGSSTFQYRTATNGATALGSTSGPSTQYWVRLTRTGGNISGYTSADGITWNSVGTVTLTFTGTPQVCLATSSVNASVKSIAVYQSVSVAPFPFSHTALNVALPDYLSYDDNRFEGLYKVTSSGSGMGESSDSGDFVCRELEGDGSISARVNFISSASPLGSSGVMIRQSFSSTSVNAFTAFNGTGAGWFQARSASSTVVSSNTAVSLPYYARVVRAGNLFSGYVSQDTVTWTLIDTATISMTSSTQACLVASSGLIDSSAVTLYDSVSVLPAPWFATDIAASLPGFSMYNDNQFILVAGGPNIGGVSDSGHFMCQRLSGNVVISARVASVESVGGIFRAGVMFRDSLAPDSVYSFMFMGSSGAGYNYYRTTTGGNTVTQIASNATPPRWVRIERVGTTFRSSFSSNGSSWTLIASPTIANINSNPYVCLAASSGSATAKGRAVFDSLIIA